MSTRRRPGPEYESDLVRDPALGYGAMGANEFVRCIEHGSPTPLERWHHHDEYELQLIVGTGGRAFVGDYVGYFEPGHLVLTGPRLPHNWVSDNLPPDGLAVRSLAVQFKEEPLLSAAKAFPSLLDLQPLLQRAARGVEFFGIGEAVRQQFQLLKDSRGFARLASFFELLSLLERCQDYRLLSVVPVVVSDAGMEHAKLARLMRFVDDNYREDIALKVVAELAGLSESGCSRFFRAMSGSTLTAYINKVRIGKACEMLAADASATIADVCYAVGFNNVSNFNRRFLQLKGVTPRAYRKETGARA